MRSRMTLPVVGFVILAIAAAQPATAQLWKKLVPVSHVAEAPQRDLTLMQQSGPWLIVAEAFSGDGAEQRARQLAEELRSQGLDAYIHDRTFDFAEKNPGRGLDAYGAPIRKRYQHESDHQWAVLVGDFTSVDDPDAQSTLERIKSMPSKVLGVTEDETGYGQMRQYAAQAMDKLGRRKERGPMANAFLTRNPLLPQEYFVPKGVDDFVARMNDGVEFSLLKCPGRYTVQVATFRGQTVLQTSATKSEASPFGFSKWRKDRDNPLVEAAENAHLLAEELRKHGYEAYEFHGRTESIVTIGSFNQVAQHDANGQAVPTVEVQRIIQKFGAAYDTPSDPLTGDDVNKLRRAEDMKQQFNQALTSQQSGQIATGLNPKHVKIMKGKKVHRIIPIDVYPYVIEVPRKSISGAYAGQR
jgi:hypothetical protein